MSEVIKFVPKNKVDFQTDGANALALKTEPYLYLVEAPNDQIDDVSLDNEIIVLENYRQNRGQKEVVGSDAFNLEYERDYADQELRDDVVSYLGEYRLRVPKFEYELVFGENLDDQIKGILVRDSRERESMRIKAQRSIHERKMQGKSVHREESEYFALSFLDQQMSKAKIGDTLLWGSPPGPKEEGYGDYGFLFYGKVRAGIDPNGRDEKRIEMKAIRVEKPSIAHYNVFFNEFVQMPVDFSHADEYLASPFLMSQDISENVIDGALKRHFDFEIDNQDQDVFEKVIADLNPVIDDFIVLCKTGTKFEKLEAFYALENYAISLRDKYKTELDTDGKDVFKDEYRQTDLRLSDILDEHGHRPPKVAGSCGSTESTNPPDGLESNNIMSSGLRALMKALGIELDEGFTCPKCLFKAVGPIGDSCPGCKVTKQEYAKMSGAEVCD